MDNEKSRFKGLRMGEKRVDVLSPGLSLKAQDLGAMKFKGSRQQYTMDVSPQAERTN